MAAVNPNDYEPVGDVARRWDVSRQRAHIVLRNAGVEPVQFEHRGKVAYVRKTDVKRIDRVREKRIG
jgi:hypothetical protein